MSALDRFGLRVPIVQAPMAGVGTPALAAAVSEAGALGSVALGALDAAGAAAALAQMRGRTERPFAANLFVHATPVADPAAEARWLAALAPEFARYGAAPPATLVSPYTSFAEDDAMLAVLLAAPPAAVSFHFGLPSADRLATLRAAGCVLIATATSPAEARLVADAGLDLVVAQGWEAGGHRGVFDADAPDDRLGTAALTRLLVRDGALPVIAAGGLMDGAGVRAALALGAVAAQLGTAFVACPESAAAPAYREALAGPGAAHTAMTRAISGRPARSLANRFTAWGETAGAPPTYPLAYAAGKALHAAATAAGEPGWGAHWAGQGAPLARAMPAGELVATLWAEAQAG